MSIAKEQRIDKLRKTRVWPSIVFFVLSLLIAIALVTSVVGLFMSYIITNKVTENYNKAVDVGQFMEKRLVGGDNIVEAVNGVRANVNNPEALYAFDKDNKMVAGYGGDTYNLFANGFIFELTELEKFKIYPDKNNETEIVTPDGSVKIKISKMLGLTFFGGKKQEVSKGEKAPENEEETIDWMDEEIYSADYWHVIAIGDGGEYVLVKNPIAFVRSDMFFIFGGGILALVLIIIPLIFQFINLISNIKSQQQMSALVYTDPVTGGYNKLYFEHQAKRILTRIAHNNNKFAVIDLTMRKYRNYCACHGTNEGENLLERMDEILNMNINKKWEVAAHSAYGTYALLLRCHDSIDLEERIMEMIYVLRSADIHHRLQFDVGVNIVDPAYTESDSKIKRKNINVLQYYEDASIARYTLRDKEDDGIAFFDEELLEAQKWEHTVEIKMAEALKNEEFVVYYQPKYNPVTMKLVGAEALIRWISPEEGFVPPGRFIPIFEKNGFITRIDDYMISHVAKQQAEWIEQGKPVVPISVNVSRAHFSQPDLAEHICRLVDNYKTPHKVVEIELTESAFFDDKTALTNTVDKLKKKGFEISMDDFGSGYSSLNSLKDLPLDVLKLDAEFFRGDEYEGRGKIVVGQAIALAKQLNMRIVAEGVERKDQVEFLAGIDCDMIQGFYFSEPLPVEEFEKKAFA